MQQLSGRMMITGPQRLPAVHGGIGGRSLRSSAGSSRIETRRMLCSWKRKERMSRIGVGEATEKKTVLVRKVTSEELEVAIQNRDKPIIIDFYASWCGPCVLMATELDKVAKVLGDKVEVLKIDTDENPELSSQLRIQALPTTLFVGTDPSKPALRVEGHVPAETVIEIIENGLQAPDSMEYVR